MYEEDKNFKSTTVELFGTQYKVSSQSSSSITSKKMLFLGYAKYLISKVFNKIFPPIKWLYNKLVYHLDLLFLVLFLFSMFVIFPSAMVSYFQYEEFIKNCNADCSIYKKYCVNYVGFVKDCIRSNVSYVNVFMENLLYVIGIGLNILYYVGIIFICIMIIIAVAKLFYSMILWCCKKLSIKMKKINQKIPDLEVV